MSKQIKWTPDQLRAIQTHGQSLLVSAAAGSGKTEVLAQRCAYLICDAKPNCEIDQLLVVTFTKAAAEEMRQRIGKVLRKRAEQQASPSIDRQIALLPGAQISTLHGLCNTLIKRHFNVLGLDPSAGLIDDEEGKLLRKEVGTDLVEELFDDAKQEQFRKLIELYFDGRDTGFIELLLALHGQSRAMLDADSFLQDRRAELASTIGQPLAKTSFGKLAIDQLKSDADVLASEAPRLLAQHGSKPELKIYRDHIRVVMEVIADIFELIQSGNLNRAVEFINDFEKLPTLPSVKNKSPIQEQYATAVTAWKDRIKIFLKIPLLNRPPEVWAEELSQTLWGVDVVLATLHQFGVKYAQSKYEQNVLDYNDLEHLALRLLREGETGLKPSAIAIELQKRFKHVLVDEYQDINAVQDAILKLISTESSPSQPGNLFCVGDVKQSIYRFRYAQPMRFIERYHAMKKPGQTGEVIDLRQNFRTRAPIIDILNQIFRHLMTAESAEIAYDESHQLVPGKTFIDSPDSPIKHPVDLHYIQKPGKNDHKEEQDESDSFEGDLESSEREATVLSDLILKYVGARGNCAMQVNDISSGTRKAEWRDIVILLRTTRIKAEQYSNILRSSGIPVQTDSTTGFFDSTEIRDMLALLTILNNYRQDIPMAAVLRSPLSRLPNAEDTLARVRLAYPYKPGLISYYDAVRRYVRDKTDKSATALKAFLDQLEQWRYLSRSIPVADLIGTIYQQTQYTTYCAGLADGAQRTANLTQLHDYARTFGQFHRQGLSRFISYLNSINKNGDIGQADIAGEVENAVRIMTIHKSKGLEFPIVIVPDLGRKHNYRDGTGKMVLEPSLGLALHVVDEAKQVYYPSLLSILAKDRLHRASVAEELRVLYVALTRAKEKLILMGTASEEQIKSCMEATIDDLTPSNVIRAVNMLQWIGSCATEIQTHSPGSIQMQLHTPDSIDLLSKELTSISRSIVTADQLVKCLPLEQKPVADTETLAAIARITQRYTYENATKLPAVTTVTKLAKSTPAPAVRSLGEQHFERSLHMPAAWSAESTTTAAEIGSINHLVLQHLDFSKAKTSDQILQQIDQMIERQHIRPADTKYIRIDAIQWLLSTTLGELMIHHASALLRELDVTYSVASSIESTDPLDRIMVRGRVDVIVPTDKGLIVVDYKTDRVSSDNVPERAKIYKPQITAYSQQLQRLSKHRVISSALVFLTPRVIFEDKI